MGRFWIWELDLGFFIFWSLDLGSTVYGLSMAAPNRALDLCSLHSLDFAEYVQSTAKKNVNLVGSGWQIHGN